MNDLKINTGHSQSNPAVKVFGNAEDRTTARTSYPSSVNESKSFSYACKNSVESALTGPLSNKKSQSHRFWTHSSVCTWQVPHEVLVC